ncbi:MAG TPA: hypothetical protein VGC62_11080 [Pseudomonas sp.]|uniref:hypothetical protein n=1 Tax=Pseudomonas sp. TaxID=306 RepID=UPI002ED980EF
MSDSMYVPPTANLNVEPAGAPAFFTVSTTKFMTMLLATSGLYGWYWFYKNWALYRRYSGRSIWPIPRAVFGLIFLPSLFCKLDRVLKQQGKDGMPFWRGSAALFILIAIAPMALSFLVGLLQGLNGQPFSGGGIVPMIAASIIPLMLQSLILLRVQRFINVVNDDPSGNTNARLTHWNWVWIVIGLLYWFAGYLLIVAVTQAPL